jgi:hypothetical protein
MLRWQRAHTTERADHSRQRRENDPHRVTRDTYRSMIRRCYAVECHAWASHGGSGVTVCERWRQPDGAGFANFLADLGERPVDERASERTGKVVYQTLGRYRDQGNYEPGNCEWMTWQRQAQHKGPQAPRSAASSRFKGVHRDRRSVRATIWIDGKHRSLGHFRTEEAAARAYDTAAREAWGEDCWLNFPSSTEIGVVERVTA